MSTLLLFLLNLIEQVRRILLYTLVEFLRIVNNKVNALLQHAEVETSLTNLHALRQEKLS